MAGKALNSSERDKELGVLNQGLASPWSVNTNSKLAKSFKFDDFNQAWRFMSGAALYAERHDHHPEWFNVYNKVDVELTTHDAGGVSAKDFALARFMESLL